MRLDIYWELLLVDNKDRDYFFPSNELDPSELIFSLCNSLVDHLSAVLYLQQVHWSDPGNWAGALVASPG